MTVTQLQQEYQPRVVPAWMPSVKVRLKIGRIFNRYSRQHTIVFAMFYARLIRVYGETHALELKRMWQRGEL